MKTVIRNLKAELKVLAATIRTNKLQFKEAQRTHGKYWEFESHQAQWEFRNKHIVRCLLRGRTMEQIENTQRCANENGRCRDCGHPDQSAINSLLEKYKDEALHRDEIKPVQEPASSSELPCSGSVDHAEPAPLVAEIRNDSLSEGPQLGGAGGFMAKSEELFRRCWRDLLA